MDDPNDEFFDDLLANLEESFQTNDHDISALCCDEEFIGFDKNNGSTWIYPTNYPIRDYQYNIVNSSLFKNTLVSLPTGLGKTFIAAVVMYNYYRWYPMGKIIFVAPTRPLVAQQIDACYNIMAIPSDHTVEMTGTMPVQTRKKEWQQKRVIFATPQVVQNDLESGICPGELIRCIVIDEAHRARGRHAYCQVVELLTLKQHYLYRVLALSATPGSKVDDVIHVVKNLKISHLELRTEQCLDVSMYSHARNIKTVIVPLGDDLTSIRNQFIEILDIYTRRLVQCKVLTGNIGTLSKGKIIMLFKEYQTREKTQRHPQHKYIMLDFTMVITLYHALELLTRHGARVFLNFFDDHTDKTWVGKDDRLVSFLERLRDDLGTNPMSIDRSILPDGSIPDIKEDLIFGHPKFDHLKSVILEHFNDAKYRGEVTKAIVFCEYRESVNLVHCLLLQCRPLIKPQVFVGQGSGKDNNLKALSQKQQLKIMNLFRQGLCNVLVSTCVGEEGLDVGNVDLIVCFDISNKSPVRLVQRCGRTGRERNGKVVILVTEGREHQTLRDCMFERDNLNKKLLQSKELKKSLYDSCPRMFPTNIKPVCQKMFISVQKKSDEPKNNKGKKTKSNIKDSFSNAKSKKKQTESAMLSEEEFISLLGGKFQQSNYIKDSCDYWNKSKRDVFNDDEEYKDENLLSKYLEWQRNLQYASKKVGHSFDSKILCELLQYADSKRFDIDVPTSSLDENNVPQPQRQIRKNPVKIARNANKKESDKIISSQKSKSNDIRQLFKKIHRMNNKVEAIIEDKREEILNECGIDPNSIQSVDTFLKSENIPSILLDFAVELDVLKTKIEKLPKYNCPELDLIRRSSHYDFPSAIMIDYIMPDVLNISSLSLFTADFDLDSLNTPLCSPIKFSQEVPEIVQNNCYFDNSQDNEIDYRIEEENKSMKINNNSIKNNLDLIDIDGIFNDLDCLSSDEEKLNEDVKNIPNVPKVNETNISLSFFGLNDIDEIFESDPFNDALVKLNSPDNDDDQDCLSPIISTQNKKLVLVKTTQSNKNCKNHKRPENVNNSSKNVDRSTLLSITQALDVINTESDNSDHSIILSSQIEKVRMIRSKKTLDRPKPNIIIPASSESSDNSSDEIGSFNYSNKNNVNIINISDDEAVNLDDTNIDDFHSPVHKKDENSPLISLKDLNSSRQKTEVAKSSIVDLDDTEIDDFTNSICDEIENKLADIENKPESIHRFVTKKIDDTVLDEEASPFFNNNEIRNMSPVIKKSIKQKLSNSLNSKSLLAEINNQETEENQDHSSFFNRFSQRQKSKFSHQPDSSNKENSFYDSDDDFVKKPSWKFSFGKRKKDEINTADDRPVSKKKKKRKKQQCDFIDYEAVLSDDDAYRGGSSEDSDCSDESHSSLKEFICDENAETHNDSIDIRAKYLQSIKSPVNVGKFKIPQIQTKNIDVCSQYVEPDVSYELDSFCVGNDHNLTQVNEMSELEIAEALLKRRKRKKCFKKILNTTESQSTNESDEETKRPNKKKRPNMRIDSDSDSNTN